MTSPLAIILLIILGTIVSILFWSAVVFLLSFVGGWHALAKHYRTTSEFIGEEWPFAYAVMRFNVSYRGAMTIGADTQGLYLSTMLLFRAGHPPLFIPWSDITVKAKRVFFVPCTQLHFKKAPSIPISLTTKTAHEILAKSGRKWLE